MIPEVGTIFNGINTGIDLARGNYGRAAMDGGLTLASVIPMGAVGLRGLQALKMADEALETAEVAKSIAIPYGLALQSAEPAALAARSEVEGGATLYRIGTRGISQAGEAQFWALEHPSSPGYAMRYGIPPENVANADFIETGTLRPGANFVTRPAAPAPGMPESGGAIEAVTEPSGVRLRSFSGR